MPEVTFKNRFVGTIHGQKIDVKPGDRADVPERLVPLLVKFQKIDAPEATEPKADTADQRETATDPTASERETREDDGAPKAEPSAAEVREWAKANDIEVPSRGGVPGEVRAAYLAAHSD